MTGRSTGREWTVIGPSTLTRHTAGQREWTVLGPVQRGRACDLRSLRSGPVDGGVSSCHGPPSAASSRGRKEKSPTVGTVSSRQPTVPLDGLAVGTCISMGLGDSSFRDIHLCSPLRHQRSPAISLRSRERIVMCCVGKGSNRHVQRAICSNKDDVLLRVSE